MVKRLINGHYYITVATQNGQLLFVDGGCTKQTAIARCQLLYPSLYPKRMRINGIFRYNQNRVEKYKFVMQHGRLKTVKKTTA